MIAPAALAEIYAHARECYPDECCGYVRGATVADEVVRCRNAQRDGEHPTAPERDADTGFVISGAELFAFARSLDSDRPARVLYHSHTNGRAYFSQVDREVARGGGYPVQHLVVGVTAERVTEAAMFAWSDDKSDFVEVGRWVPEEMLD